MSIVGQDSLESVEGPGRVCGGPGPHPQLGEVCIWAPQRGVGDGGVIGPHTAAQAGHQVLKVPVIAGEGKERKFRRLVDVLLRHLIPKE